MNPYERMHPPGGYGLGRHGATPQPPAQSAQQLAEGSTGATTATPDAATPQGPQQRAQHLLSQRRAAPAPGARPAAAPSLAAPPPAAPAPASPLAAPPPVAPAPAPLAAPAPVAQAPNQWGIDFSTPFTRETRPAGWSDTMESIANPNAADPGNNRGWQADPRSNPNNTMSKFMVPSTHQEYYDFDNPAIQASPGGTLIGKDWASEWNPQAYAKPAPIVDSLPPPNQLPGYVNPANRGN